MVSAITTITVTAISIILLVMFCWFCWSIVGLRKLWYRLFKRKQINMVLDLLYDNENNPQFKHTKIEKYISLGFYNPALFEIAEKIYFKQTQRTTRRTSKLEAKEVKRINKLNAKEIKYGRTKQDSRPIREDESFEEQVEEYPETEYPDTRRETRDTRRFSGRRISTGRNDTTARIEPRADSNYPARVATNSQATRQRDLSTRDIEKPSKKSRYFD